MKLIKCIKKRVFPSCLIMIFCFGLFRCSTDSSSIEIPSFGVDSLLVDMQGSQQEGVTQSKAGGADLYSVKASSISCESELMAFNAAPQLAQSSLTPIQYLETFSAQVNFYDCNVRQQASEGEVIQLNSGQYISSQIDSENPENSTFFVSWVYDEVDVEEEVDNFVAKRMARGKLVNLSLQDDGIRNKTRVDLSHENGERVVKSFLYFNVPAEHSGVSSEFDLYTKILFKEIVDEDGQVVEQKIGGRHYNTNIGEVIAFASVVKAGVGSVVFLKKCTTTDPHATCDLSSGTPEAMYYHPDGEESKDDANGGSVIRIEGLPEDLEDIGSDYEAYFLEDYYDGQSEEDYLKASFDPDSE